MADRQTMPPASNSRKPSTSILYVPSMSDLFTTLNSNPRMIYSSKTSTPSQSNILDPSTYNILEPSTSKIFDPSTSNLFEPPTRNTHEPFTSNMHTALDWSQLKSNYETLESSDLEDDSPEDDSPSFILKDMQNLKKAKDEYIANYDFPFCSDLSHYNVISKIGEGAFGEVFKASTIKSNKSCFVAIKKIKSFELQGFPITSQREVRILKTLNHINVVKLIEVCQTKPTAKTDFRTIFHLVFEFCDHDLSALLLNKELKLTISEIKGMMQQLLTGIFHIHQNKILHRDLKTANILITNEGIVKIADFGLSRAFSENIEDTDTKYTNRVITLWYRPPELLLGATHYGPSVDLWGVGCIFAEMFIRWPLLRGATEQKQLLEIIKLCGPINPQVWPDVEKLRLYKFLQLPRNCKRMIEESLKFLIPDTNALNLLEQFLTYDPKVRINADMALNHEFFWSDPMPSSIADKIKKIHKNNFEYLNKMSRYNSQVEPTQPLPPFNQVKPNQSKNLTSFPDRIF